MWGKTWPPIGTRCKRITQEFEDLNEEMGAAETTAAEAMAFSGSDQDAHGEQLSSGAITGQNSSSGLPPVTGEPQEEESWSSFSEFRRRREEDRRANGQGVPPTGPQTSSGPNAGQRPSEERQRSHGLPEQSNQSQGIYCQVPWEDYPQNLRGFHQYPPMFRVGTQPAAADCQRTESEANRPGGWAPGRANVDYHMDYRMSRLEKSLGDLAEAQKALLQHQAEAAAKNQAATTTKKDESSDSDTDQEPEEWKDNFSDELWKNVKGKREKNPFEQSSYLKKGEAVDSIERVLLLTFKTIAQLVEVNGDVRGVVRHGLAMAEKAAKGVYKVEAFTKYDESVRERAGAVGPGAFGTVDQEDTLRFFSFDNVERSKGWKAGPSASGGQKKKSEKMCLKYNDQGCTSKTCFYSHRCAACEELGHPRKECKNLKKKDK